MERGKVKHSNNGDSCFSLFEKIHFVLLSAPSSSPRPALNSSRCLLLLGLIREREREREDRGKGERETTGARRKEPWPQLTLCGRMWQEYHSSPTHPWALSTPKWFNTEIKMAGGGEGAVKRQRLTSCFVASLSFVLKGSS